MTRTLGRGPADTPAGDTGGLDADEQVFPPAGPGLDARPHHLRALVLGLDVVGRALDEDAPPFPGGRADLVDLESHDVVRVGYAGPQVLSQRAVLPGPEYDGLLGQRKVDRQHGRPVPARVPDPADAARRDQPQALRLVERFHHCGSEFGHLDVTFRWLPSRAVLAPRTGERP